MRSTRNISMQAFLIGTLAIFVSGCVSGNYHPAPSPNWGAIPSTVSRGGVVYEVIEPGGCYAPTPSQMATIERLESLSSGVIGAQSQETKRGHKARIGQNGECDSVFESEGGSVKSYGDDRIRAPRLESNQRRSRGHGHYAHKVWVTGHGYVLIDTQGRLIDDLRR